MTTICMWTAPWDTVRGGPALSKLLRQLMKICRRSRTVAVALTIEMRLWRYASCGLGQSLMNIAGDVIYRIDGARGELIVRNNDSK